MTTVIGFIILCSRAYKILKIWNIWNIGVYTLAVPRLECSNPVEHCGTPRQHHRAVLRLRCSTDDSALEQ